MPRSPNMPEVTTEPGLSVQRISRSGDRGHRVVPQDPHPVRLSQGLRLAQPLAQATMPRGGYGRPGRFRAIPLVTEVADFLAEGL